MRHLTLPGVMHGHLSRRLRCTRLHYILWWSQIGHEMGNECQKVGAPGGIRTPDLLIRSPKPAEAASLPNLVLNRAVRQARIGVRSQ